MTITQILDRASAALPSIANYYNDSGAYVEGAGDILAAYIAKALMENYDPDADLGDGGIIAHLTSIFDQAMVDLTMVCEALETGEATT